jgi:hypothetical protein
MSTTFVPPRPSVLKRVVAEQPRRPAPQAAPATAGRSFQVLQSSRAPAQLSLFLRPGAIDVK